MSAEKDYGQCAWGVLQKVWGGDVPLGPQKS